MDQSDVAQNRKHRRSNVLMSAVVDVAGLSLDVKLRNLSEEGALIEGERLPVEGSEVYFRKGDIAVKGRVAWSAGKRAGIAFNSPITTEAVLHHCPPPRALTRPSFRRPGLAARELSAEEQALVKLWSKTSKLP